MWHCSQVLLNQCVSWLLHGLLLDPFQEFFVQKNVDPIGERQTYVATKAKGFDALGHDVKSTPQLRGTRGGGVDKSRVGC